MTWYVMAIILAGILKFATNPPSAFVAWILSKFELQPKLSANDVHVTYNGKLLAEREKLEFIDGFNKATFLNKYFMITGSEEAFLNPKTHIIPFIIQTKSGKNDIKFTVYCYKEHIDVVKLYKKKVTPYRVSSSTLQIYSIQNSDY
ncbi:YfmQ family protein [Bacillus mesophilum]|uniref:Uncharacterized protein n=1 Tax=Bacillus mesophilum TaxID=1071718 RepID=A0A7V7RL67_9BACI|nr:YfmQ family protein [Bacillus mesophilum]KAB2331425.1 hypothetical protein F7732_16410 [Bacillus mesophilum]